MAIQRVKPISRHTAQVNLSSMILSQNITNTSEAIDYFIHRFMTVPPGGDSREMLIEFLTNDLGTQYIIEAQSYMEDSLRMTLHLLLIQPEYQLS